MKASPLTNLDLVECPACGGKGRRMASTGPADPRQRRLVLSVRMSECRACRGRGRLPAAVARDLRLGGVS